jgi:DNA-binding transcriptional regulator PaaX
MSRNSNKTAEILRLIQTKKVATLGDLSSNKHLLSVFSSSAKATPRRRIIDTAALLARQGYVSVGLLDNEKVFKITEKGKARLKARQVTEDGLTIPERWDGRWYLITFDIPESKKVARNQLIITLKKHGFINYAKGLWLIPYNPTRLVASLRKQLGLKSEIRLIVAQAIDGESKYRKHWDI